MGTSGPRATYSDAEVRISVLWKAQVQRDRAADERAGVLNPARIADIFDTDLRARGIALPAHGESVTDSAWVDLVHSTYYPPVTVDC
jgi:hypothetical protein